MPKITVPLTEVELAELLRSATGSQSGLIRRLAFERDQLRDANANHSLPTCAFCHKILYVGPEDGWMDHVEVMQQHMMNCESHPMRALEQRIRDLEKQLAGRN